MELGEISGGLLLQLQILIQQLDFQPFLWYFVPSGLDSF